MSEQDAVRLFVESLPLEMKRHMLTRCVDPSTFEFVRKLGDEAQVAVGRLLSKKRPHRRDANEEERRRKNKTFESPSMRDEYT
mmetsp:Transcript_51562/g.129519  ORF Transcript_51562/g.129519 Transcript_51562/m.129519 type:complete len:83 (+) Transcript_51562:636-884(+)